MSKRWLSIGFMGRFGRSAELLAFDAALRAADLHPRLVPEAVKLAAVGLLLDEAEGEHPHPEAMRAAAEIITYCLVGADAFAESNGASVMKAVETRIEAAIEQETSLDARLILLMIHANVIQPSVMRRFRLASDL